MFTQRVTDQFLKKLDKLEYGRFELVLPDGKKRVFEGKNPGTVSSLSLHDWKVVANLATHGDIGFAEDYKAGLWETASLPNLLTCAMENDEVIEKYIFGNGGMQFLNRFLQLLRLNTLRGSRRNISAHYDLGNEFYALWLDPSMTYSSALYRDAGETLHNAQMNKYDRIIDRLNMRSGSILEVGCGWGGFAERALQRHDYALKGITLSQKQQSFAQQKLGDKASIVLEDYRHQSGKYDSIVSIEMFEAVGMEYWATYFSKIKGLLQDNGRAVIQTITIADSRFDKYRQSGDFIRSYIFPGGLLPSPSLFRASAESCGLRVIDQHDFGQDYARTLEIWLENFDNKSADVRALGYDDGFIRMWRFYLAACIAAFKTGRTDVMQVELQHG
ncbi:MAG TPA: cyclopropane-fatty-acyl-phospholipid synthase family protein [Alphaproteobacteria bacterium]|nr:cyclopropane-fatty-acyl-phospholipid synthase family protein [Alphaproteobacteria bacterium]